MLKARHDAARSDAEWRSFLSSQDFGQLIAAGRGDGFPIVVPAHYVFDGDSTIELHLHRENPVWATLAEDSRVVFSVIDAHVYVPTHWNADPGADPYWSAPTSYYAAVQVAGLATIVDAPAALAGLLGRQMMRMQPEGGHAPIEAGPTPYGRMLRAIRGLRLELSEVRAKFKFGGNKTYSHQAEIARRLLERGTDLDRRASDLLLRRRGAQRRDVS